MARWYPWYVHSLCSSEVQRWQVEQIWWLRGWSGTAKFLELTNYPAGHINLVICRDVHCGYPLWLIPSLRMSITRRSQMTSWWSCVWESHTVTVNNQCKLHRYTSRRLTCRKSFVKYYSVFATPHNISQLSTCFSRFWLYKNDGNTTDIMKRKSTYILVDATIGKPTVLNRRKNEVTLLPFVVSLFKLQAR